MVSVIHQINQPTKSTLSGRSIKISWKMVCVRRVEAGMSVCEKASLQKALNFFMVVNQGGRVQGKGCKERVCGNGDVGCASGSCQRDACRGRGSGSGMFEFEGGLTYG